MADNQPFRKGDLVLFDPKNNLDQLESGFKVATIRDIIDTGDKMLYVVEPTSAALPNVGVYFRLEEKDIMHYSEHPENNVVVRYPDDIPMISEKDVDLVVKAFKIINLCYKMGGPELNQMLQNTGLGVDKDDFSRMVSISRKLRFFNKLGETYASK